MTLALPFSYVFRSLYCTDHWLSNISHVLKTVIIIILIANLVCLHNVKPVAKFGFYHLKMFCERSTWDTGIYFIDKHLKLKQDSVSGPCSDIKRHTQNMGAKVVI